MFLSLSKVSLSTLVEHVVHTSYCNVYNMGSGYREGGERESTRVVADITYVLLSNIRSAPVRHVSLD